MNKILSALGNHKAEIGIYVPSLGVTLAPPSDKIQLVTSLKQVQFLDTAFSVAAVVEIGAGVGVLCMLVHYGFRLFSWVKGKIDG